MALKFSDFSSGAALAEKGLEIAQRVGKWGIPGVVIYDLGAVVRLVIHPSWQAVEGACSTIGISLVLIAILASVKRGNEITVNITHKPMGIGCQQIQDYIDGKIAELENQE